MIQAARRSPKPASKPRNRPPVARCASGSVASLPGPGLVTGAADDDPSGIATYSQIGAQFGFAMLWTLVLSYPLMAAIQEASAWIARVSGGRAGAQYPGSLSAVAVLRGRRHFALCECDQSGHGHRRHGRRAWLLARAMTAFQEAPVCSTRR